MQSTLRRIAIAPAVIMAVALAANPAVSETTTIKVPFSFEVAGKTFPAGNYSICRDDRDNFVTLRGSSQSFSSILGAGASNPWEYKIALNFDLVGQTHLLQSIQYGTMITSKLDKKALESERGPVAHAGGR